MESDRQAQQQEVGIVKFEGKFPVRFIWYQGKMYFSLIDIVYTLTETENPRRYWSDLKRKLIVEGNQTYEKIVRLKMQAPDGRMRLTDAIERESVFRIIQSIPSPKVEPFKLWLAESAELRLQTIEKSGIDVEAERHKYRLEGRSEEWIEKRIQSILIRNELTQEWDERGAKKKDYGPLTNTIARGTFAISVQDHRSIKGLRKENLRDHMTPMELVLTMLGEVTTTELHRDRDSIGFSKLHCDAKDGGAVAGRARQDIEQQLGAPVVSSQNYLSEKRKQCKSIQPPASK